MAFSQDTPGVPDTNSDVGSDCFGKQVAVGDVDGDGRADALIGVNGVDKAGTDGHAGGLWVLPGSATGSTATGSKSFSPAGLGLTAQSVMYLGWTFNR